MTQSGHRSVQCAHVRYDPLRQPHFPIYATDMDLRAIFPRADITQSRLRASRARRSRRLSSNFVSVLETKMMQKIARSIIQAWLLSVAILISGAHYNVAQAQDNPKQHRTALCACGKEIKKQCSGGAVAGVQLASRAASSVLECFQKSQEKLPSRCAALANNVVRTCDADAARLCQGVVAGSQGNIVGCLTMAKNRVSSQCNAALDAAFLR